MKDVFVSHSKEDKGIAKKLVSKLEASGISCYVRQRDIKSGNEKELIADSNIFIMILSESSQNSEDQIRQMKIAVEESCIVVPFRTGKTDKNLSTQYLLHSLEWVDPFEDGFDEAFDILLEIIEENSESKPKSRKTKKPAQSGGFQVQKSHLAVIITLFAVIIIYLIFFNEKNTEESSNGINNTENIDPPDYVNSELKPEEKVVVGSWKMVDYEDSRSMSPEELAETMRNVEELKKRVLLTFRADRSFIRSGFTPQAQKGWWEYDPEKSKIYLTPENVNQREEINIMNLSETDMAFIVTEVIQNQQGITETVTTKLSFKKQ